MTREADARRPFLFLALSAFMGMLLYFAADYEPSLLTPLVGLIPILILIAYAMPSPTRELLFLRLVLILSHGVSINLKRSPTKNIIDLFQLFNLNMPIKLILFGLI